MAPMPAYFDAVSFQRLQCRRTGHWGMAAQHRWKKPVQPAWAPHMRQFEMRRR